MTTSEIKKLQDVVKGYIDGEIVSQEVTRLTEPGENYGSLLLKVDIKVKNRDNEKSNHMVAKCVPPNPSTQQMFNTKATFPAEIGWYSLIIPTLKKFQRKHGVENVIDSFCEYYGSRLGLDPNQTFDEHGLILLENLTVSGFKNEDRFKGLDEKTANAVLKTLAEFHAVPIAIKLTDPQLFKENIQNHLVGLGHLEEKTENPFESVYKSPCDAIAANPEVAHLAEKAREECKIFPFGREGATEPWSTTLHMDFWTNNMMVKQGDTIKVKIVDLQTTKYGTLTNDLVFFLMTSIQTDIVKKHFDKLMKVYYDAFIKNLKALHVDTSLFPYEGFLKEVDTEGKKLFSKCLFFVTVINASKGTSQDVNDAEYDHVKNVEKMFSVLNDTQKQKIAFLVAFFDERKWI